MKYNEKSGVLVKFFRINKKLATVSILVTGLIASVCYAAVFAPEWTEFCPPRYIDAQENIFSKDATYWYKRRLQFERALQKCLTYKGKELDYCYAELRAAEERKNKVWAVRQEEKFRTDEYNREYNMEKMKYDGINRMIENIKK